MLERMWSKGDIHAFLVGVQTCKAPLYISMAISQKIRKQLPEDTGIPLLGIYPKDAQSYHKDMH